MTYTPYTFNDRSFPNIANKLRKERFESFEEICTYSKILRKLTCVQKF